MMSPGRKLALITANVVGWAAVHVITGYTAHRLSRERLDHDWWIHRRRPWENDLAFYRSSLHIHAWKDRLPEAGAVFPGGVSKRNLPSFETQALSAFINETRRAELAHWWALAATPIFALLNPPIALPVTITYGVGANMPFIAIQRYNRQRTEQILVKRAPGQDRSEPSGQR